MNDKELRKLFAALLAAVFCVGVLAGCRIDAGKETESGAPSGETGSIGGRQATGYGRDSADDGRQEVSLWYYWETESHQQAIDKVIRDYNASQDEVTVETRYVPFADFKKQLSIGASADELPDMAILDSSDHASYAAMGIFADLTGKFDTTGYYAQAVESCMLDGKLYGVPFGVNCLGLFCNQDLLAAQGCKTPATWKELKETAEKLTGEGVTGLAFSSLQNEEGTFNFMPWIWSAGADFHEINSEEGVKALTLAKDLTESGAMSKECISWTQGDVMNQFISGNVAMMVNGSWQIPTMEREAPDMNWIVALIPRDKEYASVLGGENYAVIAGGNEEAALKFLEYATAEEQVSYLTEAFGYLSADKKMADNPPGDEVRDIFMQELEYAKARGPLEEWPEVSDAISLAFNQVMTGEKEPQEAAKAAQQKIDKIMESVAAED